MTTEELGPRSEPSCVCKTPEQTHSPPRLAAKHLARSGMANALLFRLTRARGSSRSGFGVSLASKAIEPPGIYCSDLLLYFGGFRALASRAKLASRIRGTGLGSASIRTKSETLFCCSSLSMAGSKLWVPGMTRSKV